MDTTTTIETEVSGLLDRLAESLDIPPSKYRDAVVRYNAVASWLGDSASALRAYRPSVYTQGSFRIGTVVRPLRDGKDSDYDIDLVCELEGRGRFTARELKHLVGDRLKEHGTYRDMLDQEGKRCWTLKYAETDGVGFHLDALAGQPESEKYMKSLVESSGSDEYAPHAIAITERLPDRTYRWVEGGSNPAGFAAWFDQVNEAAMRRLSSVQKSALYESNRHLYSGVQDVPNELVRTPLQRAIQLLKRHRDVRFANHELEKEKPISMIITTLAAHGFRGETEVLSALQGILERIDDFSVTGLIEERAGLWWVPNPVNPGENFADRWNEQGSRRAEAFFEWVAWARQDLAEVQGFSTIEKRGQVLAQTFAVSPRSLGLKANSSEPLSQVDDVVPGLASRVHRQSPPWPEQLGGRVEVVGSVRKSRGANRALWNLSRRAVLKERWLRFEARTNVRPPFRVHWQVVNTGSEAAFAGAKELRGGFDDGGGLYGEIRWERTLYRGTHTIEAFVVKDGVCVARSGETQVRIK